MSSTKVLGIIGAGELGLQIAHMAEQFKDYDKVVFFDDFSLESTIKDYDIIGKTDDVLEAYNTKNIYEFALGIGYKHMDFRRMFFKEYSVKIPFANIIHPSCIIDPTVKIGSGVIIYQGCILDKNVVIRDNVLLNIGCAISHDTKINSHCFISPRVAIAGFVEVGENSIIGINSTVIDNIKISSNVQLGGGTVLIRNADKAGLYVGNPAKFLK